MKIFWNIFWVWNSIYNWICTCRSPLRCWNLTFRNIFSYLLAIYTTPHFLQFNQSAKTHSVWSLGYGLNSRGAEIRFLARKNFISSLKRINRYGALLTAYAMAGGVSFPERKAAPPWSWLRTLRVPITVFIPPPHMASSLAQRQIFFNKLSHEAFPDSVKVTGGSLSRRIRPRRETGYPS